MEKYIIDARINALRTISNKKELFVSLCSLNLLNALIKIPEYKNLISYSAIKPIIGEILYQCIDGSNIKYSDEIYYNNDESCVYIRCFGFQFSFHNIGVHKLPRNFINSKSNTRVLWDGIRLQPIALELYNIALTALKKSKWGKADILNEFKEIINND